MRARKKNLISNERKEKLIHKETLRFLNILETYSSETNDQNSILVIKNNSVELYEKIANHIRECLEKDNVNNSDIRDYLNHEEIQIKNIFLDNSNDSQYDTLLPPSTSPTDSEIYTQTIFDITTRSHDTDDSHKPLASESEQKSLEKTNLNEHEKNWTVDVENHVSTKEIDTLQEPTFNNLKSLREEKFSNLKTREIPKIKHENITNSVNKNISVKHHKKITKFYKDKNFTRLSEQAFLKNIFHSNPKKMGFFRYLKYLFIKKQRDNR